MEVPPLEISMGVPPLEISLQAPLPEINLSAQDLKGKEHPVLGLHQDLEIFQVDNIIFA
jgi:hypothetical protein